MSRIGKKPVVIPANVEVRSINDEISAKGPKGEIKRIIHPDIRFELNNGRITLIPRTDSYKHSALWGLMRSLVANMVEGVTSGFEKKLEYEGIGFRASVEQGGKAILFQLGFSHPVRFEAPEGISFGVEKNVITVSGIEKQLVGEVAARIRALKPPEPYKGKGIRYRGEVIRRKAGKKATSGA